MPRKDMYFFTVSKTNSSKVVNFKPESVKALVFTILRIKMLVRLKIIITKYFLIANVDIVQENP